MKEIIIAGLIFGAALMVSVIAAAVAHGQAEKKGYPALAWALISFILPPACLVPILMGPARPCKCSYCAETIKKEARVCKHCGRDLPS